MALGAAQLPLGPAEERGARHAAGGQPDHAAGPRGGGFGLPAIRLPSGWGFSGVIFSRGLNQTGW